MLLKLIPFYQFVWIDELMLYHRKHQKNNTNHVKETADCLKSTIEETLRNWGNVYAPVFRYEGECIILDDLIYIDV
ncbi:hypothetical protein MKX78_12135 [Cytobacillus sp. FSL R5-0569]|uniref:hypothetical protein n=1 Tax=Cytobacillus sp. FSL R5-0569 TaxID=2921649 RepID=UPI0030F9780D